MARLEGQAVRGDGPVEAPASDLAQNIDRSILLIYVISFDIRDSDINWPGDGNVCFYRYR